MTVTRALGWKAPRLPERGLRLGSTAIRAALALVPGRVQLGPLFDPTIWDQARAGSCVGQSTGAALDYLARRSVREGILSTGLRPAPRWLYYIARELEGTQREDAGAMIGDALRAASVAGIATEVECPYDDRIVTDEIPRSVRLAAAHRRLVNFDPVAHDEGTVLAHLALGYPVVIGVAVYDSFFDAPGGDVPVPGWTETRRGGHAICLTGYDTAARTVTFRNSWGGDWGHKGYGTLPIEYVTDPGLCGELWVLRAFEVV